MEMHKETVKILSKRLKEKDDLLKEIDMFLSVIYTKFIYKDKYDVLKMASNLSEKINNELKNNN